jgi:hypothetical protein
METAKEYVEKHNTRINEFLDEFEANSTNYIEREFDYFENTLYDVQNSEGSHDGHSLTGFDNFSCAYEVVQEIGYDKFMYSTKAKLEFLVSKIDVVLPPEKQEIGPMKQENKNLLLNGKDLNLSERFKIANEILDIGNTIRRLNIKDLEKYKLLSYIINCSEDNARHLMNGKYNSKDRDLTGYFKGLNLNK